MNSNIVRPGIMFQVIKPTKDNIFGTGTTGFIVYVKGQDQDFPNVVFYKVIIIRRGKSGKTRLEPGEISIPIFLPKCKNLKTILPKINRKHFVFVDTSLNLMPENILNLDDHLFFGWASSWAYFLNKLHTTVKKIKIWPNDPNHVLNMLIKLPDRFTEDPTYALKNYSSQKIKTEIITEIRYFESTLSRCAMEYLYKVTCIEQKALINLSKNAETLKLDKKQLEKTSQFIENRISKLEINIRLRKQGKYYV